MYYNWPHTVLTRRWWYTLKSWMVELMNSLFPHNIHDLLLSGKRSPLFILHLKCHNETNRKRNLDGGNLMKTVWGQTIYKYYFVSKFSFDSWHWDETYIRFTFVCIRIRIKVIMSRLKCFLTNTNCLVVHWVHLCFIFKTKSVKLLIDQGYYYYFFKRPKNWLSHESRVYLRGRPDWQTNNMTSLQTVRQTNTITQIRLR